MEQMYPLQGNYNDTTTSNGVTGILWQSKKKCSDRKRLQKNTRYYRTLKLLCMPRNGELIAEDLFKKASS